MIDPYNIIKCCFYLNIDLLSIHFRKICCIKYKYYKSFLPSTIRLWNDLSPETRDALTLTSFKYQMNKNIQKPPRYFTVGFRFAQIQHIRLRTSCSSLNHHLFSKNIINDPYCQCGSVETTKHYLFECQRYSQLHVRQEMLNEISKYCTPSLDC